MKAEYVGFYLDGREARLIRHDIDVDDLAETVLKSGKSVHDVIHDAVKSAAQGLSVDRQKRQWLRDNEDDIKEAGGSEQDAWQHFVDGKIDELVSALEPDVIEALTDTIDAGEGEGGEDEDDGDDDEDEDEDKDEDAPGGEPA